MAHISEFKKGDIITRVKPAKSLGPMPTIGLGGLMGQTIDRGGDRSYLGDKLKYIGIANGQIYVRRTDDFELKLLGDKLIDLAIDLWDEGWEYWIDPETLTGDEVYEKPKMTQAEYQAKIDIAIAGENYEEAERLKKEMEENK